ncbi:MAG: hypothetical protein ACLFVR_14690 [Thiohalospira sp.]
MNEKELLDLKEEINEAKTEVAELKGQRKSLMTQLKDTWGCSSIEKAQEKIKLMRKSIEDLQDKINEEIEELEKYFENE